MKLLYRTDNGDVWYAVWDFMLRQFSHSTSQKKMPLTEFWIDEVEDNLQYCRDIHATQFRFDTNGRTKYYVEAEELYEREDWQEEESEE